MNLERSKRTFISAFRYVRSRILAIAAGSLSNRTAFALFQTLCNRFHVDEVISSGDCGRIQGHVHDAFIFNEYLRRGSWAPACSDFLKLCFTRSGGGTYLDIGANIGLTAIPIAKLGNVRCSCFEPEPRNVRLLERNLRENCAEGSYQVFPMALYSSDSSLSFELAVDNRGDHRIRSEVRPADGAVSGEHYGESKRTVITVPAKRLDDVLPPKPMGEFVAIKCDTQGAELNVYLGGTGNFARADVLLMEFWPYGLNRLGSKPEQLIERLSADFQQGMLVSGRQPIRSSDLLDIAVIAERLEQFSRDASGTSRQTDVLLIKSSARSLF